MRLASSISGLLHRLARWVPHPHRTGGDAPGAPGATPHWASSAKTGIGTSIGRESNLWFSLTHGIISEVFYPFVDSASIRGLGFVVTDRHEWLSDELHDADSTVDWLAPGIPAFRVRNRCRQGRYEIAKTILSDPRRSVLLQETEFQPLATADADLALFVLLAPHLDNQGADNSAWIDDFKGMPMLFARYREYALALACSVPWLDRSAGFVGRSDGRRDLEEHKQLAWHYQRAEHGNVLLAAEIDLAACDGRFTMALGFGRDEFDAAHRARASLMQGFVAARDKYVADWRDWQRGLNTLAGTPPHPQNLDLVSATVIRVHESKDFPGGIVASLSTPWGVAKGDQNKGYHRAWPRDLIQAVGAMLAIGRHEEARRVLFFLHVTQEADGHWPQNMFLSGRPSWDGIQLDEMAFPILMVDLARREQALEPDDLRSLWPMARKAASYLVSHGPVTPLDRWEEESGYFASTLSVEIAALLAAAAMADENDEPDLGILLRDTADMWNNEIESLLYVTDTELARAAGVDGYYVRFARPDQRRAARPAAGTVTLKNHAKGEGTFPVDEIISPDALTLVRYGVRAADDRRIVNTVRVIDHLLKVTTPYGDSWHRYNHDGYGEHADGSPFDGTGIGRAWPLLTGERAHYELAAGHRENAERLLQAMAAFANPSGLIPEQVWDTADVPEHQLFFGRPSGSAMPLVWAHAEYLKLRRSLGEGKVFDLPVHATERYRGGKVLAAVR
ncbi:MAG TPA: glycoside hydrolase family 15 protein [Pirellulales bacterium]|nr:glycoside hydrolase family 15 protein [Pirellulales bacterium]